jgi:hypothetical protein
MTDRTVSYLRAALNNGSIPLAADDQWNICKTRDQEKMKVMAIDKNLGGYLPLLLI